jgi:hypothetical protein
VLRRRVAVKTGCRGRNPKATGVIEEIAPQSKTWQANDRQTKEKS